MKVLSFATMLLCSSAAMAHHTLDYPSSRGFSDDNEPNAPCGGFNNAGNRTQFPLTKGFLEISSYHVSAEMKINVAFGNNPSAADFSSAATKPANSISINHPGHACLPLELASFNGAINNTNATIQIVFDGGDGPLYQCADVLLVTSAPNFDQTKCVNDNGNSGGTSPSSTSSGGATNPTKAPNAGVVLSTKSAATATVALLVATVMAF